MKKLDLVNPNTVMNVEPIDPNKSNDNYIYLVKLISKETVLMRYNPLAEIKQFVSKGFAVVSDAGTQHCVTEIITYIDFYGTIVNRIQDDVMALWDVEYIFDSKDMAEDKLKDLNR